MTSDHEPRMKFGDRPRPKEAEVHKESSKKASRGASNANQNTTAEEPTHIK